MVGEEEEGRARYNWVHLYVNKVRSGRDERPGHGRRYNRIETRGRTMAKSLTEINDVNSIRLAIGRIRIDVTFQTARFHTIPELYTHIVHST